jgi:4-hydroxy-tetrahydrodipicolinate synthase
MSNLDFLQGAYWPLIVPFRDGKFDFDTYGKLIERQILEGSHGPLVNATSGEPTTLTVEERGQLVEFAIKTSNGRRPGTAFCDYRNYGACVVSNAHDEGICIVNADWKHKS